MERASNSIHGDYLLAELCFSFQSSIARSLLLQKSEQDDVKPMKAKVDGCPLQPSTSTARFNRNKLCTNVRRITAELLSHPPEISDDERSKYGPKAKAVILRVRQFFEELKTSLGPNCAGTMFDDPDFLTAAACGVSQSIVALAVSEKDELTATNFPTERHPTVRTGAMESMAAVKKHGPKWGDRVRQCIRSRIAADVPVTISCIRDDMMAAYPDFPLRGSTLHRFIRGLGFDYKVQQGKKFIFERKPVRGQSKFHQAKLLANAIAEGECFERQEDSWAVEGTVKKRGWCETRPPLVSDSKDAILFDEPDVKQENMNDFDIEVIEEVDLSDSDGPDGCQQTDEDEVYSEDALMAESLLFPKQE
ncbi:hypothetical protein Q1695_011180 [Nippostrongylus brasiliensis]|nr:hypothetical protein Q1695_011180 [Nippostrongylus brasiliensis]